MCLKGVPKTKKLSQKGGRSFYAFQHFTLSDESESEDILFKESDTLILSLRERKHCLPLGKGEI